MGFRPTARPHPGHALACAVSLLAAAAQAQAALVVTKATDLGLLEAPLTLSIGGAFNDLSPATPGLQLAGVPSTVLPTDTVYEGYGFQTGGASFGSIVASLNLGTVFHLSDLQLRLYEGTLGGATTGTVFPGPSSPWSIVSELALGSSNGNAQEIAFLDLAAGSYVLEVRANVTGTSGGSYGGTMSFAPLNPPEVLPIPEPGTFALTGAGLLLLMGLARRGTRA